MPIISNNQLTSPTTITKRSKTTEQISTLRRPPYTYMHLSVARGSPSSKSISSTQLQPLDEITLRAYLTAALNQYLGLTGTAIPIDILKVEPSSNEGLIRLSREDEGAVVAAFSQWIGGSGGSLKGSNNVSIRVNARGAWLGGLTGTAATAQRRYGGGDDKLWSLEV